MQAYNKAFGSGVGGSVGVLLGALVLALFQWAEIEVTPEIQESLNVALPVLGGLIVGVVGTYAAPKNKTGEK